MIPLLTVMLAGSPEHNPKKAGTGKRKADDHFSSAQSMHSSKRSRSDDTG